MFGIPPVLVLLYFCHPQAVPAAEAGPNSLPVVRIKAPENNSAYTWSTLVNYSVVVTYLGKSTEYQEIPSNQVLLTTRYVPDPQTDKVSAAPDPAPAGLVEIIGSNCMGCHEFKARAMGPSFAAMAARYPENPATIDTLSRNIREGSSGMWGSASMPPHPELTEAQAHSIAQWIEKNAANPNVNYYVGTEGAFRMEAPSTPGRTARMILTASYTVPAAQGQGQALQGHDTVILQGK